jgi:CRP-like cAMP-binding protein
MQATIDQLQAIPIFAPLTDVELAQLQPHAALVSFQKGETVMHEGDRLPSRLYAIASGSIRITKTASSGKETILRLLTTGEIFAAPALFGNGIAPASVVAETDCQILTVERVALLDAIRSQPELAISLLSLFNQRLQQLHTIVHGLVSERAIVRLVQYLQYFASEYGTQPTAEGECLQMPLSYYQIARSIGITYEECVRLFKQLHPILSYRRGGKITVRDWQELGAIAAGSKSDADQN